ncbi:PREDICTED: leucine-rich repeat-containing protein 63 [Galeopterus variegatus]|uniref:Leucine-rich repeat-containing protein 63 n=1 Tax=Galeopterus variegatus TaxID=482537 RepID=A0ABM0RS26_GALVR|nr:PREDICTED: leucine-rich repeat-containing protein 63 [Galeopterus variegatus]
MVTRPLLTTESIILESQESARVQQGATVVLSISHFPGITFIPTPILPRKPRRQSILETLGTENENVENVPKQITPRSPEGLVITRRKESLLSVLRGEGFKTIRATRYETVIAMANMAIVNCQINGRNALNLKGFFLLKCPDLTPLAFQLIYLDLSFNDLRDFPMEILCLKNLQILKLRNNPIKVIPFEIQQIKFLRIFIIAFNLITDLPHGLFLLTHLEELDISYNDITSIPSEIQKLRSLEKLNIDGNELTSLPSAILKLNLTKISCENNFIHPSFWKENSLNSPQRLTQITSWFIVRNNLHKFYDAIPAKVQKLLKCTSKCEWCHGPKFGKGFRVIRSCDIFGASQLPVMFHVCSSSCYRNVKKSTYIPDVIPDKRIPLNLELREG